MNAPTALMPLSEDVRPHFSWLTAPHLQKVIAALEVVEPDCVRFVGGCVRDSLLGVAPKDFDVATTLTPEVATAALKKAGLGVAPTGIEHGTITAIVDHQGVEVTTLRADVSTDGRRATVAFTRDWSVDAARRDFTVNAIYLTPDARLFDPVGGWSDARGRHIRFIGDPKARIREDYLRILRFFRFSARFCESFDHSGLAACAALKDGIEQLSAERVGAETTAILALPRAAFALAAMRDAGVLAKIWSAPADIDAASRMKALDEGASAPLMLAVLYGLEGDGAGQRLRLSNAEKSVRSKALDAMTRITPSISEKQIRALLYRFGKDVFDDGVLLATATEIIDAAQFQCLKAHSDEWLHPRFAITGGDIVKAGVMAGPAVSKIHAAIEAQWIAEDFPDERRQQAIFKSQLADHKL